MSASCSPVPPRSRRPGRKGVRMPKRRRRENKSRPGTLLTAAAAVILGGVLAVRWLVGQHALVQAGLAAGVVIVLAGWWAVLPQRRLPRHRVRHMRIRARLRL